MFSSKLFRRIDKRMECILDKKEGKAEEQGQINRC